MSQKEVEALKKALTDSRAKCRILEACLNLGCRVWIDIDVKRHPYPKGLDLAVSYRAIGEGDRFIVLGNDFAAIEEMAQTYAEERFKQKATEPILLEQSNIGLGFDEYGAVWQVIAPCAYGNGWLVMDSERLRRRYLNNTELGQKGLCNIN